MHFDPPLTAATFIRRYKRFFVDAELPDGTCVTAHVAATGAMTGCSTAGMSVGLSFHPEPGRTLRWSLQLVKVGSSFVLVNSILPNRLVEEAIREQRLLELVGYGSLRREVAYEGHHRIDLLLERPTDRLASEAPARCWLEIKNATLEREGLACFPDAVTERGTQHLMALKRRVEAGDRAVLLFLVGRSDCRGFRVASEIDPVYARALELARAAGVEVLAYDVGLSLGEATVRDRLPVL